MPKCYTLIGSRETPDDILELMEEIAVKLNSQGWVVRSGGADGADTCAEQQHAYEDWRMEIYLPWNGFNGRSNLKLGYIDSARLETYGTAQGIAEDLHPNWEACSRGARALHTRNVFQIMGKDLDKNSKFVICWAIPTGDGQFVKGGTGQAVRLAITLGIPIFNLYHEEVVERLTKYLEAI